MSLPGVKTVVTVPQTFRATGDGIVEKGVLVLIPPFPSHREPCVRGVYGTRDEGSSRVSTPDRDQVEALVQTRGGGVQSWLTPGSK